MKPEVDFLLRSVMEKLLIEVAPTVGDAYVRSNVEVMAVLMAAAAEEYDRAAHVRAEENEAMRRIFRDAASSVLDVGLRARLEVAAAERDASLRVSDLSAANDRLRALLIELHALVETREESWARRTNRAIWEELRGSTRRRAISLWP
ncbi:MAG TPA: hypothetical protein VLF14_09185, partial [Candidatus Binatia bacterium]|nr:hypothetical protein [Candidatus Binatia bacterium]